MATLGPGLLLAALALFSPSLADTGGMATASLHIGGQAGGAAATGGCIPLPGDVIPTVYAVQGLSLFEDDDGDGLLDPGDLFAYTVVVENSLLHELQALRLMAIMPDYVVPTATEGWTEKELGGLRVLFRELPPIPGGGRVRVGFAARFTGTVGPVSAVPVHSFLYRTDLGLAADDPRTASVLDPVVAVVREVAGGAADSQRFVFMKRASSPDGRMAREGDTIGFTVSYSSPEGGTAELWDPLPPVFRVIPGSVDPPGAEVVEVGGVSAVHARLPDLAPGERAVIRYRVEVRGRGLIPFVASRAWALTQDGDLLASDDPDTALVGDPTVVFLERKTGGTGEIEARERCVVPILIRDGGGLSIHWAACGRGPGPEGLVFAGTVEIPINYVPEGTFLGLVRSSLPPGLEGKGDIYVQVDPRWPIFAPLAQGVDFVEGLRGPYCADIRLSVLVRVPFEPVVDVNGVIVDEGL